VWQVLPLGPTGYGDSPYQTLSAFAGNPNLISLDKLVGDGFLTHDDLADVPNFPADRVDYGWVIPYHNEKLDLAYSRFEASAAPEQKSAFEEWCTQNAHWLDDYVLFIALKQANGGKPWVEWTEKLALRDELVLKDARQTYTEAIQSHAFRQWLFHKQWYELKGYANQKGVRLFGDIPIVVAHDSTDVWANRDEYYLDEKGNPTVIAGVPPDYFSPTGQRWGNPLYRWDVMKKRGYSWWISRVKATLNMVDYIRIDHFRGLAAYWEIPAEEETAVNGQWVKGPSNDFLATVKDALGELPIIAEDLGVITQDVEELRDNFNLPGMKVLQFAWSDPKNLFLPHNHVPNCVVYSGTHDNNTTIGWWQSEVHDGTRHFISTYLESEVHEPNWKLIQVGMQSVGHTFIAPMQDVMALGGEARMNQPGNPAGNWAWRFISQMLDSATGNRLKHYTRLYQRAPDQQERVYGDQAL
jgi:4-alpha-glucanotransferase